MERTKYLDRAEAKRLRDSCSTEAAVDARNGRVRGPLAWLLVDLALGTGLRVCELASLTWADIDFRRRGLWVNRRKRRKPAREFIPLGLELRQHLQAVAGPSPEGPIFTGKRGPLSRPGLQALWRAAVTRAGLQSCGIHAARHTYAVELLAATGNLRQVQLNLGHTRIDMTAQMYADVQWADRLAGVDAMYRQGVPVAAS